MARLITAKWTLPTSMRFRVDADKAKEKIATRMAALIRKRLRSGKHAGGQLQPAKDDAAVRPWSRTGEMIKSIKKERRRRGVVVAPTGYREDGSNNPAVVNTLIDRQGADPFGVDAEMASEASRVWSEEVQRQIWAGKAGLVAEIRRLRRRF